MQTLVRQHTRKRKNGVSIIRKHKRIAVIRKNYGHSYDEENGDMIAHFPGGAKYRYHKVTPKEYKEVQKDKWKALAKFKVSKTYSPENDIAKKSFKSATAKKKAALLAKKITTAKKSGAKSPGKIVAKIKRK